MALFQRARYERGADGYWEMDWRGDEVIADVTAATIVAMDVVMEVGVDMAKANHQAYPPPSLNTGEDRFHDRTGQTVNAIKVLTPAHNVGTDERPHVFGDWGIEDGPAYQDPDIWRESRGFINPQVGEQQHFASGDELSIVDRAMLMEFGAPGHYIPARAGRAERAAPIAARPFIYPAWDASKRLLPAAIAAALRGESIGEALSREARISSANIAFGKVGRAAGRFVSLGGLGRRGR